MGDSSAFEVRGAVSKAGKLENMCMYTEAPFTNLPSKMLAARVFSFKQETQALASQESASPKRKTKRQ